MPNRLAITSVVSLSLCLMAPASANLITAASAGALPATAQDLSLSFPTEIRGTLTAADGVNMFKIWLDASLFSALTVLAGSHGIPDPELFLFDLSGAGVYMNDDKTFADTQSCLPAAVNNPCPSTRNGVGPTSTGLYYLAITRSANLPLGANGLLFSPLLSTEVAGPISHDPITGWDGGVNTSPNFDQVDYDIFLTGTVPEPATWMVTAAAGLAFAIFRKRLSVRASKG